MATMVRSYSHSTRIAQNLVAICGILILTPCFYGCAYKFSNTNISRPGGIRSIAVESVYDTSREYLPHEHLWKNLQQAIIADGNLVLTDRSQADAILRVHLEQGLLEDVGDPTDRDGNKDKDPDAFSGTLPPKPEEFRRLSQAGSTKGSARLSARLAVEVWDLRTKVVLFKRNYKLGTTFKTFRTTTTGIENDYLRFEEAKEQRFAKQSRQISRRIVRDILASN